MLVDSRATVLQFGRVGHDPFFLLPIRETRRRRRRWNQMGLLYPLLFVCVRTSPGILPNTQNPSTKRHRLVGYSHMCRWETVYKFLPESKQDLLCLSWHWKAPNCHIIIIVVSFIFLLIISFLFGSPSSSSLNNNGHYVLFRVSEKDWDTLFFSFFFFFFSRRLSRSFKAI